MSPHLPSRRHKYFPSARQVLIAAYVGLGLLCQHSVAAGNSIDLSASDGSAIESIVETKLRSRRDILGADSPDRSADANSLFEQAFRSTFPNQTLDEPQQVLWQFAQLVRWVDEADASQPSAARLAFLPECGSNTALRAMREGVRLSNLDPVRDANALLAALRRVSDTLRSASVWHGYPATRRLLLGALLKLRMAAGGELPPRVQPAVDDLLRQLFQMHVASVANRGVVQFFHISKSGGTNLCQAAEANGCASQGFDTRTNCLIRDFYDQPRWVTYTAHKYLQSRMSPRQALPWYVNFHTYRPPYTCEQRRAYLLRERLTFYANEYTNPPGSGTTSQMCPDFVNLIMFRHPYDRLRSQIGWVQKLYKEFYLEVDTQAAFVNRTTGFWERLMPAGVNNYYIRSLLGQRFFEFPVLYVTRDHTALAKLATLQHDILLTLEVMGRNDLALRVGLGWSQALRDGAVRSSTELGDPVALPLDFDAMLERNSPDVEVFDFARSMQALDTLLWSFAAAANASGPVAASASAAMAAAAGSVLGAQERLRTGSGAQAVAAAAASASPAMGACGYVSLMTSQAVEELQTRLQGVVVPPKVLLPAGTSSNSSSEGGEPGGLDAANADGAGSSTIPQAGSVSGSVSAAAAQGSKVGAAGGSRQPGVVSSGAAAELLARGVGVGGKVLSVPIKLRPAAGAGAGLAGSPAGERGQAAVSISHRRGSSRHLLRLKGSGAQLFSRRRQSEGLQRRD